MCERLRRLVALDRSTVPPSGQRQLRGPVHHPDLQIPTSLDLIHIPKTHRRRQRRQLSVGVSTRRHCNPLLHTPRNTHLRRQRRHSYWCTNTPTRCPVNTHTHPPLYTPAPPAPPPPWR